MSINICKVKKCVENECEKSLKIEWNKWEKVLIWRGKGDGNII